MGFFEKFKNGLKKTSSSFVGAVTGVLSGFHKIDEELFEQLGLKQAFWATASKK